MPELIAQVMDNLRTVEEAVRGYRAELMRGEWSDRTAEDIASALLIDWNRSLFRGHG